MSRAEEENDAQPMHNDDRIIKIRHYRFQFDSLYSKIQVRWSPSEQWGDRLCCQQ